MDTEYLGYILKLIVSCFCLHQGRRRTEKNVVRHEPESASKTKLFFCCMGAKIILISIWSVFAFLKSQRNWNQSVVSCWKPNWVLLKASENHLFAEIQNRGWGSFLFPFVLIGNVT